MYNKQINQHLLALVDQICEAQTAQIWIIFIGNWNKEQN